MKCPEISKNGYRCKFKSGHNGPHEYWGPSKGSGQVPDKELYLTDFQKAMINAGTPPKDCPSQIRDVPDVTSPSKDDYETCPQCDGRGGDEVGNQCELCGGAGSIVKDDPALVPVLPSHSDEVLVSTHTPSPPDGKRYFRKEYGGTPEKPYGPPAWCQDDAGYWIINHKFIEAMLDEIDRLRGLCKAKDELLQVTLDKAGEREDYLMKENEALRARVKELEQKLADKNDHVYVHPGFISSLENVLKEKEGK